MYILGQICGLIGTVITVITPQFRKKEQMMLCNALVNAMNALNFWLIGQAGSAISLCLVGIAQSLVSIWHERRQAAVARWETVLFFLLYVGFGFYGMVSAEGFIWELSWQNALELLPIIGALMLMLSVFAKSAQRTRFFLLCNGAVWAVYSAIAGAAVFFTAVASAVSSLVAMLKYRRSGKK